ncbi:MAG: hypothetical protein H0X16_11660 [Chloroflexi bacterium]|nr:hypothetical protein [Chloroflexota bacterium]
MTRLPGSQSTEDTVRTFMRGRAKAIPPELEGSIRRAIRRNPSRTNGPRSWMSLAAAVAGMAVAAVLIAIVVRGTALPPDRGVGPPGAPSPSLESGTPEPSSGELQCAPPDNPLIDREETVPPERDEPFEPFYQERDVKRLNAYAARHADEFGGSWIDWETETITLTFTQALERHRAGAQGAAPGAPIRILRARHTEREMRDLQDQIAGDARFHERLGFRLYSAGYDVKANIVQVEGAACRPETAEAAFGERYGEQRVRPTIYPLPGPEPEQPQAGDGWRLVAELAEIGEPYTARFLDGQREYDARWSELDQEGRPPPVDFEHEAVIDFGAARGLGGECGWAHLTRVVFDKEERLVYGDVSHPVPPGIICAAVAVPQTFLVAVDRSRLPERPFTVRLSQQRCGPCTEEVVVQSR